MTDNQGSESLGGLLAPHAARTEDDLKRWLVEDGVPAALAEAMRYAALDGGKRLRPALVWLACRAAGGEPDEMVRRCGAAVEMVHSYSLVHDDLPAMDDDALRRGRPTVHVKFGQAMAILAGDALLTRAFGVLSETHDARAPRLAAELALGAGAAGMIAGQVGDMRMCDLPPGPEGLRCVHARKTGALIRASARMGALCAGADAPGLECITRWAESLGLAFQVVDDILDVTGDVARLGKTPGKDARGGKRTYVSELGLEGSLGMVRELTRQAAAAVEPLGPHARDLSTLARLLADRTH